MSLPNEVASNVASVEDRQKFQLLRSFLDACQSTEDFLHKQNIDPSYAHDRRAKLHEETVTNVETVTNENFITPPPQRSSDTT